jgi:hypothetical protein
MSIIARSSLPGRARTAATAFRVGKTRDNARDADTLYPRLLATVVSPRAFTPNACTHTSPLTVPVTKKFVPRIASLAQLGSSSPASKFSLASDLRSRPSHTSTSPSRPHRYTRDGATYSPRTASEDPPDADANKHSVPRAPNAFTPCSLAANSACWSLAYDTADVVASNP